MYTNLLYFTSLILSNNMRSMIICYCKISKRIQLHSRIQHQYTLDYEDTYLDNHKLHDSSFLCATKTVNVIINTEYANYIESGAKKKMFLSNLPMKRNKSHKTS